VTLSGLPAGWASWPTQTVSLAPDAALSLTLFVTPTVLGHKVLDAQLQAAEDTFVQARATAGLNVVDRFIQVTS